MLDLFGIVFSTSIMFLVILRAIHADKTQPWFEPPKPASDDAGPTLPKMPSWRDRATTTKID